MKYEYLIHYCDARGQGRGYTTLDFLVDSISNAKKAEKQVSKECGQTALVVSYQLLKEYEESE